MHKRFLLENTVSYKQNISTNLIHVPGIKTPYVHNNNYVNPLKSDEPLQYMTETFYSTTDIPLRPPG